MNLLCRKKRRYFLSKSDGAVGGGGGGGGGGELVQSYIIEYGTQVTSLGSKLRRIDQNRFPYKLHQERAD